MGSKRRACAWALAGVVAAAAAACSSSTSGTDNALADSDSSVSQDSGTDATLPDAGDTGPGPVLVDSALSPTDSGKTTDTAPADEDTGSALPDTGSAADSGTVSDTGTAQQDSAPATGDCGTTPTLHPGTGTSLYCPFGPGGTAIECVSGSQMCCISGKVGAVFPPSDCEALSDAGCTVGLGADAGSAQIGCEDPATDCPAGSLCCGAPDTVAPVAACGYERLYDLQYTRCEQAAACGAGELQVCASAAECPVGQTCTPFKATLDLGFCK